MCVCNPDLYLLQTIQTQTYFYQYLPVYMWADGIEDDCNGCFVEMQSMEAIVVPKLMAKEE